MTSGLTYQWTQIGDDGLPVVGGVAGTSAIVTFPAPNTPTGINGTTLKFRLTVSDGRLTSFTETPVTVRWSNDPPFATIACPLDGIVVNERGEVELDGSASFDLDDGIASYFWQQQDGGPDAGITGSTTQKVTFSAPSLSQGQLGVIYFTLIVTDQTGDPAHAECAVAINDITPPVISAQGNIIKQAESADGAVATFTIWAQDAAEDEFAYAIQQDCIPPSGHLFPLGILPVVETVTPVICKARDGKVPANEATREFTVTVRDTTAPVITVPDSYAIEATGSDGAVANYIATTSDAVDGAGVPSCLPADPGSTFVLGTTLVTCSATDARGNAATPISFNLTVYDITPPVVAPPPSVTKEATGEFTEVDYGTATATDDVFLASLTHNAPAAFPVGPTIITWTATDSSGNEGTATSTVTVTDKTPPTLSGVSGDLPGIEATSPAGAPVSWPAPAANDIVDGGRDVTCESATDPALTSGSTFPLGTTTVTCSASDTRGNSVSGSFGVTVVDTTPPTLEGVSGDLAGIEATSPGGTVVAWALPTAIDIVDGGREVTCKSATPEFTSGSIFPLGTTTVTCSASDARGNSVSDSFDVTVIDTTPPTLEGVSGDLPGIEATSPGGTVVAWTLPTAIDIVDGGREVTCKSATPEFTSGSTFPLGTTTVTCSASDTRGNSVSDSFDVTVVDTTPPVIAPHEDITREATGASGASVGYIRPATSDIVDGPGSASCAPVTDSLFALGETTVFCAAVDHARNYAVETRFKVFVVDTTPPTLSGVSANKTSEATSAAGAVVSWNAPTAWDIVDGSRPVACAPASGSTFALGTTEVTCSASDTRGHDVSQSFNVTVRDTTGPMITQLADIWVVSAGNSSKAVFYTPTASDLVDGPVDVSCTPASGSTFAVNAEGTLVTCTAHDGRTPANVATPMTFRVHVAYSWTGFFQPVDNNIVNTVKAGSAIPVKFNLGGNQGLNIFATNSPASVSTQQCDGTTTDEVEVTVTAGNSSLSYDAGTNQYIYVWKTDRSWLGCRQLRVTLRDGSVKTAMFKFR